jgi:hypothetical protein
MKWMVFVFCALAFSMIYREANGKPPKTLTLSESEVGSIQTAIGYTTMLQFDARPTSAVLGDQDAFKVEYVGNALAIKPILPHAKTNLFVFTDYDRFNFRLATGSPTSADFVLKVKREGYTGSEPQANKAPVEESGGARLIRKTLSIKASCGGLNLLVQAIAWPESQSTYLIQFRAEAAPSMIKSDELKFEPGDFEVLQGGVSLPIESLHLDRLSFTRADRAVQGTLVLRQSNLKRGVPLQLAFLPDFHRAKSRACPKVLFSRNGSARSSKPSI